MSDKPQTTRNKVQGVVTSDDSQFIFIDTPGIHKPKHKLGDFMVKVARNTLKEVDVIMFMVNADEPIGRGDRFIIEMLSILIHLFFSLLIKSILFILMNYCQSSLHIQVNIISLKLYLFPQ